MLDVGALGNVLARGSNLRESQLKLLDNPKLGSEQKELLATQLKMQNEAELVSLITNLMKAKHESTKAILNNLR